MVHAVIDAPMERIRGLNGHNGYNGHTRVVPSGDGSAVSRKVEMPVIEEAVRTILRAVGDDPDRPGLLDTPRRVARMYKESHVAHSLKTEQIDSRKPAQEVAS